MERLITRTARCLMVAAWLLMMGGPLGCASALCELRTSPQMPIPTAAPEQFTTAQWMMLLLRGPSHTCVGAPLVHDAHTKLLFAAKKSPTHVMFPRGQGSRDVIVWLQTHADQDMEYGPVALVRPHGRRIDVLALGTLVQPVGTATLTMSTLHGREMLEATSEHCVLHRGLKQTLCRKSLTLLMVEKNRFDEPFSAPTLDLARTEAFALPGGWYRVVQLDAQCDAHLNQLLVQEKRVAYDVSPRDPQTPRRRRETQRRRSLTYQKDEGWSSSAASLWDEL
jgi:hypothetical protein